MRLAYKISLLLILVILLGGCASTSKNKGKNLPPIQTSLDVNKNWSKTLGRGTNGEYLKLTPAISNGVIFAADSKGTIYSYDAKTGRKHWSVKTKLPLTSGIGFNKDYIFIGTGEAQVIAFKQSNGARVWTAQMTGEVFAPPLVLGQSLLVKTVDGGLNALDANTGKGLWSYKSDEPTLVLRGSSAPQVFGDTAIAGFATGKLIAFNWHNGNVIWMQQIAESHGATTVQRMIDIDVNPNIVNNNVYVATYQGKIAAVSLATGKVIWDHDMSAYSGMAVDNSHVYVADADGCIWAFDLNSGAVSWKQEALNPRDLSGPALIGDVLVVGDNNGYLHFMSQADGHFVARTRIDKTPIMATPFVNNGELYVYSSGGKLVAYTFSRK